MTMTTKNPPSWRKTRCPQEICGLVLQDKRRDDKHIYPPASLGFYMDGCRKDGVHWHAVNKKIDILALQLNGADKELHFKVVNKTSQPLQFIFEKGIILEQTQSWGHQHVIVAKDQVCAPLSGHPGTASQYRFMWLRIKDRRSLMPVGGQPSYDRPLQQLFRSMVESPAEKFQNSIAFGKSTSQRIYPKQHTHKIG